MIIPGASPGGVRVVRGLFVSCVIRPGRQGMAGAVILTRNVFKCIIVIVETGGRFCYNIGKI